MIQAEPIGGVVFTENKFATALRNNFRSSSDAYLWVLWDTFWTESAGFWHYKYSGSATLTYGEFAEILFGVMCEKGM